MRRINIAIDGFSSCGKSTLAKQLAHHLGYTYIDSGAMYRAVALYILENGMVSEGKLRKEELLAALDTIQIGFKHDDASQRSETWLNGRNVENKHATAWVRQYSAQHCETEGRIALHLDAR